MSCQTSTAAQRSFVYSCLIKVQTPQDKQTIERITFDLRWFTIVPRNKNILLNRAGEI